MDQPHAIQVSQKSSPKHQKQMLPVQDEYLFFACYFFLKNSVRKTIFPDSISSASSVRRMLENTSPRLISGAHFTLRSFVAITESPFWSIFPLQSLTTRTSSSCSSSQEVFLFFAIIVFFNSTPYSNLFPLSRERM